MEKMKIASFFCGCGGSDLGILGGFDYLLKKYKSLKTEIVYAGDIDKWAIETYNHNFKHKALCEDVCNVSTEDIPDHDILIGGFPCQTFSIVGERKGTEDPRGMLYLEMVRVLKEKQPKAFIGENVKGLVNIKKGKILQKMIHDLEAAGYNVSWKIMRAVEFGVPQKRERVFIVGIRKDLPVNYEFPEASVTAFTPLKKILEPSYDPKYIFSQRAVDGMKKAHKGFNKGRHQDVEGPCNTISAHLAKVSLNGTDPVLLINKSKEIYRRFTPREAARIQAFPDSFDFPVSDLKAYKQIGNAIPPVLMWHVAKNLVEALNSEQAINPKRIKSVETLRIRKDKVDLRSFNSEKKEKQLELL